MTNYRLTQSAIWRHTKRQVICDVFESGAAGADTKNPGIARVAASEQYKRHIGVVGSHTVAGFEALSSDNMSVASDLGPVST